MGGSGSGSALSEMKAIVFHDANSAAVTRIAQPPLRPGYMRVKVDSVALNPTDWKHAQRGGGASPFSILGCDFAGTVEEVGPGVAKPFRAGDRVFGVTHGGNSRQQYDGAFAEHIMVLAATTMLAPAGDSPGAALTPAQLATVPLGAYTVMQGLFQPEIGFGLKKPDAGADPAAAAGDWVLIYGGSTATGTLAIQYAKLAGYRVATTCSTHNVELVKSRGADAVFDYRDPACAAQIRALTDNKLRYAWDTIGGADAARICEAALTDEPGVARYGTIILPLAATRQDITVTHTLMYTIFGEEFEKGRVFPASKADAAFANDWAVLTEKLVAAGKLVPHPAKAGSGGLDGILHGLKDMEAGKVSGAKLVYSLSS